MKREQPIRIQDASVLHNISLIRENFTDRTSCSILIDTKTGEFSFPKPIPELESHMHGVHKRSGSSHDLKHAELIVKQTGEGVVFEIDDRPEHELDLKELDERAQKVAQQTLKVLNQQKAKTPREAFDRLRTAEIEVLTPEIQKHPAWRGDILTRQQAEAWLKDSPPGTFLLRSGDDVTEEIESRLHKANRFPFHCYVMTKVEGNQKIVDILLIQRVSGWAIYNDDPDLTQYGYQTLSSLLSQAGALSPLPRRRPAA